MVFFEKLFHWGKKKKKMNCHLCVKNSNFFVKGIFSSFFFIKFISKKLKQKVIERKGNISFFPFLKDIFFSFFHLQTTDTLKVFFVGSFFGGEVFFQFHNFFDFFWQFFYLEVFFNFFGIFSGF